MTPPYNCITNVLATADVDSWFPSTVIPVVADDTARDAMFPSPVVGQRVQNLGSGQYERWEGADWVPDIPVDPSIVLEQGRFVADMASYIRNNARFNVRDYYRDIDGSDWAPAFNRAVQAAKANTQGSFHGGDVYIPPGDYIINSPVFIPRTGVTPSNVVRLIGSGERTTRIRGAATFPQCRGLIEWEQESLRTWDQHISGMTLTLPNVPGVMAIYYSPVWADRKFGIGASVSSASTTLISSDAFGPEDEGKVIYVWGAGEDAKIFKTLIASVVDSDTIILAQPAQTEMSDRMVMMVNPAPVAHTTLNGVNISSGSTTLTTSSPVFTGDMALKTIMIAGAGPQGELLPIRINTIVSPTEVTLRSPAFSTVSAGTAIVMQAILPARDTELLNIHLSDITTEPSNEYHPVSVLLGGALHSGEIIGYQCDPSLGVPTPKYDTIALMFDEHDARDYRVVGQDGNGFQFGRITSLATSIRRGGFSQAVRGRFNNVDFGNVICGNGTRTQPAWEFVNSLHVRVGPMYNETKGDKPIIRLFMSNLLLLDKWNIGATISQGLGTGNGVELIASSHNRFTNGPSRYIGQNSFHSMGKKMVSIDEFSTGNQFLNMVVTEDLVNEVQLPVPANGNYVEAYNVTSMQWQFAGEKPIGTLVSGSTLTPVLIGVAGTGALSSGVATVNDARIATGDMVILTRTSQGSSPGVLSYGNIVNGTSFDVTSSDGADDGTFGYHIIKS